MAQSAEDSRVVAVALGSLFPGDGGKPIGDTDRTQFKVSSDWQLLAARAQFAEPRGVLAGMPRGYMAELLGRAAAAGEQLGLALTAVRDAEVWRDITPELGQENRRVLAGRALAEASGLWTISAGHAAVNVVARVIRAHHDATHLDKALRWHGPPEPFMHTRDSNLSINAETVKALSRAARESTEPPLTALVTPLRALVADRDWGALTARRDVGYHGWRPQSIEGGALTTNPWVDTGEHTMSLSVGITSGHVPPTLESLVQESRAGYDVLSVAMGKVFDALPAAMISANIGIWKVE